MRATARATQPPAPRGADAGAGQQAEVDERRTCTASLRARAYRPRRDPASQREDVVKTCGSRARAARCRAARRVTVPLAGRALPPRMAHRHRVRLVPARGRCLDRRCTRSDRVGGPPASGLQRTRPRRIDSESALGTWSRNWSPTRQKRPPRNCHIGSESGLSKPNPASKHAIIIRVSGVRVPPPASEKPCNCWAFCQAAPCLDSRLVGAVQGALQEHHHSAGRSGSANGAPG
jgi:hypothetical protein